MTNNPKIKSKKQQNLRKFVKENQKQNMEFVYFWAAYVKTHSDKDWSHQQNVIINSCLRNASMTKKQFFKMKGESYH